MIFFFTLVKDGMPWITFHYPEFRKLKIPWQWVVCEGTASPEHCTKWCAPTPPGLSTDGTKEYLDSLSFEPRINVIRKSLWRGKIEQCNTALAQFFSPGLLWQIDGDEVWTADQITRMYQLFQENPERNCAYFYCNYFLGPNIISSEKNTYGNNSGYEWLRVWRYAPGQRFHTHEPPALADLDPRPFTHEETERAGLVFAHYSWATERQVRDKADYYGSPNNAVGHLYRNAIDGWKRLQNNRVWPTQLSQYLPWTGEKAMANKI